MQGCCMNLEKSNKNCHKRPLKHLCTKGKKNETERVKGELDGQRLAKKTDKKKVKKKKMNKNDRADLTIKQTLELDFLF